MASSSTKLKVRHSFSTTYISALNKILTEEQRSLISGTPFAWFLHLSTTVRFARNILNELVVKWDDVDGCFLIGDKQVPMTENDFCLGLGLSTEGKDLNLKDNYKNSSCVKYVGKETKDLDLVYKCMMRKRVKKIPCSEFCSLYILVGISELLFPNRTGRVFQVLYEIVDNLSCLGNYCWGTLVYRYLVRSLCNAVDGLKKGKGTSNVYIDGCTYMLQVWFCEKFLPPKSEIKKCPRILHWMNVRLGDNIVKQGLEGGMVVDDFDVGATNDDKVDDPMLETKVEKPPSARKILKRNLKDSVMRTLQLQQNLVAGLKTEVLKLDEEVAYEKSRRRRSDKDGPSEAREDPCFSPKGIRADCTSAGGIYPEATSPRGMSSDAPKFYNYVRKGSRLRLKSIALRTPFTGTL